MLRYTLVSALLAAACATPPSIDAVTPSEGVGGSTITISGGPFTSDATLAIAPNDVFPNEAILPLSANAPEALQTVIPAQLPHATYDLLLRQSGFTVTITDGFKVVPPPEDTPCSRLYTANTTISMVKKELAIDRFYKDGRKESDSIELKDVTSIQFRNHEMTSGETCEVIELITDDQRYRFADDVKPTSPPKGGLTMLKRAERLSNEINKPLEKPASSQ